MLVECAKITSGINILLAHLLDLLGKPDMFSLLYYSSLNVELFAEYGAVKVHITMDFNSEEMGMLILANIEDRDYVGVNIKDGIVELQDEKKNVIYYDVKQRKIINQT